MYRSNYLVNDISQKTCRSRECCKTQTPPKEFTQDSSFMTSLEHNFKYKDNVFRGNRRKATLYVDSE